MRGFAERESLHRARLHRACVVVAVCLASLAAACAIPGVGKAADGGGQALTKRIWESVSEGVGFDEAVEEVGIVRLTGENAPAWLEEEVMGLDDMQGAIADGSFGLVWFLRRGSVEEVGTFIGEALALKGWTPVESGADGVETYFKQEGECSWLMAECVQTGEETAVVLHIRHT